MNTQITTTYGDGNPGPGLWHADKHGSVCSDAIMFLCYIV
jgi:hypothetical protein